MTKVECAMCLNLFNSKQKLFLNKGIENAIMIKSFEINGKLVLLLLYG